MSEFIICIKGKANVGKTQTLSFVMEIFDDKRDEIKENLNGTDFRTTFKLDRCKIGIISRGDNAFQLENDLKSIGKCDIYICTCRSKGATYKVIQEFSKGKELILIKKEATSVYPDLFSGKRELFDKINYNVAQYVTEMVYELVKKILIKG